MKIRLLFSVFLFHVAPLLAQVFYYENFDHSKFTKRVPNKTDVLISPSVARYELAKNLQYSNYNELKTSGDSLLLSNGDSKKIKFPLANQIEFTNNQLYISFLIQADKFYKKDYQFLFNIFDENQNVFSLKLPVKSDMFISASKMLHAIKKLNFSDKKNAIGSIHKCVTNIVNKLNGEIADKKVIYVIIKFTKENSNVNANVFFNHSIYNTTKPFGVFGQNNLKTTDFNKIATLSFTVFNADFILDEIRIGSSLADVMPFDGNKQALATTNVYVGSYKNNKEYSSEITEDFIVSNSFLDAIVFIKGSEGVGTGFVAREGSNNYIYTNVHVLMGNKKLKIINRNGKRFKPVSIETTPGRDVIRLKIKNKNIPALTIAKAPENNARIAISGNSGGGDVIRTIYGKVLGTGPTKIETDAEFISGNSGSPLMLADGSVVGIATYIRKANINWTNTNTPFAVTRRFAYRIDNIKKWKKISPKTFIKEANILKERENKIINLIEIFGIWAQSPYWSKIKLNDKNIPHDMRLWIEKHNDWVDHNKMRFKHTSARSANVRNLSKELIDELGENVEILKKSFKRTTDFKKRRWVVPFFKDYAKDINNFRNIILKAIDYIAAEAAAHDPVWLKQH